MDERPKKRIRREEDDKERLHDPSSVLHPFLNIDERLCYDVHSLINSLWQLKSHNKYVPCACPSSLFRKDIQEYLFSKPYVVSAKSDGIRACLLLGIFNDGSNEEYGVFLDRAYNVYKVETFADPRFYDGTLLDGEIIIDSVGKHKFVVFDTITVCGFNMRRKPFWKRKDKYEDTITHINVTGITLEAKRWYPISHAAHLWNSQKNAIVPADGLVFQPLDTPVSYGVQKDVFKWKPKHTVDFYLSTLALVGQPHSWVLESGDGPSIINSKTEFNITLKFQKTCSEQELRDRCSCHGRIVVECAMEIDSNNVGAWIAIPQCVRADKGTANDKFVVTRTLGNIEEDIRVEDLVPDK